METAIEDGRYDEAARLRDEFKVGGRAGALQPVACPAAGCGARATAAQPPPPAPLLFLASQALRKAQQLSSSEISEI